MDNIIVAASTHWDREWYRTFHDFRIRLCDLIDELLDLLEKDDAFLCYTFDGQCVVLDDYLRLYPENRGRIEALVKQGRLMFGPLYNLPDEFVGSGEALIRNFLIGDRVCRGIGGKMNAGYVPDNFGHISQLPQILNGVGIQSAFFFRGLNLDTTGHKEFIWRSPDGSEVLGEYMLLGYWSLKSWGKLGSSVTEHFKSAYQTLKDCAALDTFLLINGSDHLYQDPDFTKMLREVQQAFPELFIQNGSVEDYAKLAAESAKGKKLTVLEGELRDFRYGPDPTSVTSTRHAVKRSLYEALNELSYYTEPLCARLYQMGERYPHGILTDAWKNILISLGHDGISGCSSDEVMDDIQSYLTHAAQSAGRLSELCLDKLAARLDTSALLEGEQYICLYNPLQKAVTTVTDAVVHVENPGVKDIALYDEERNPVPYELLEVTSDVVTREFPYNSKEKIYRKCFKIRFPAQAVPPMGIKKLIVKPMDILEKREAELYTRLRGADRSVENDYVTVTPEQDGGFTVLDKKNGRRYEHLASLVSRGDIGDEYQHVSPIMDEQVFAQTIGCSVKKNSPLSECLIIRSRLILPKSADSAFLGRGGEYEDCFVTTEVTLAQNSPRIEVKTTIDNRSIDHILYAKFPAHFENAVEYSEVSFDRVERSQQLYAFDPNLKSTQSLLRPMQKYVGVKGDDGILNVLPKGLYEYHTKPARRGLDLYVTLLRSTSYMFHGLPVSWRDGQESTTPIVETHGSRELGRFVIEYALLFDDENLDLRAEEYHRPLRAFDVKKGPRNAQEGIDSFFSLDNDKVLISAVKKQEQGRGIVLRLYNTTDEEQTARLKAGFSAASCERTNLLEEPTEALPVTENCVTLTLAAKKIATVVVYGESIHE